MRRTISLLVQLVALITVVGVYGEEIKCPPHEDGEVVVERVDIGTRTLHVMYWVKIGESIFGQRRVFDITKAKIVGYKRIDDIRQGDYISIVYEEVTNKYIARQLSKSNPSPHHLAESQQPPLPDTTQPTSSVDVKKIEDSTLLKLLLLDSAMNLLGLGWQDRESQGFGESALKKAIRKLAARYSVPDPFKQKVFEDLPDAYRKGGSHTEEGPQWYLSFKGGWHELLRFQKPGKLPRVKYYDGDFYVHLDSMTVDFGNGTRIMIDDRQYIYLDGKLFPARKVSKESAPSENK